METWISRICRQTAQRQLTMWLLLFSAGQRIGAYYWRYCVNFAGGPSNTSTAELGAIQDPASAPPRAEAAALGMNSIMESPA